MNRPNFEDSYGTDLIYIVIVRDSARVLQPFGEHSYQLVWYSKGGEPQHMQGQGLALEQLLSRKNIVRDGISDLMASVLSQSDTNAGHDRSLPDAHHEPGRV